MRRLMALVISTLCAMSLVAAPSAAAQEPAEQHAAQPRIAPAAAFETVLNVLSVYSLLKDCVTDAVGGQWFECVTGSLTGPSIQDVLDRLDKIEQQMEANQRQNRERFGQLEGAIRDVGLQAELSRFNKIENNGDLAMGAWLALTRCFDAQAAGRPVCNDYTGRSRPTMDAVRDTRQYFIGVVNRWRELSLPNLVGDFTGNVRGRKGLAGATWDYFRTEQLNNVDAQGDARRSQRTAVVTHALSVQMNETLTYYASLIERYAFLSAMADGMRDGSDLSCGSTPQGVCRENRVAQWDFEIAQYITGSSESSVQSTLTRYRMPDVPRGAIAVAGSESRYIIYAGSEGREAMHHAALGSLADALNRYSSVTAFADAYPGSFPTDRWFRASVPVSRPQYIVYSCWTWATCEWNFTTGQTPITMTVYDPSSIEQCLVRMRPVNEAPSWDTTFEKWMRANPKNDEARTMSKRTRPDDGGWNISFDYLWRNLGRKRAVQVDYATSSVQSRTSPYTEYFGWGGWLQCSQGVGSTRTSLTTSQFPLFGT
jgi:hypothetical protein